MLIGLELVIYLLRKPCWQWSGLSHTNRMSMAVISIEPFMCKGKNPRGVAVWGWVVHAMKGHLLPKIGGVRPLLPYSRPFPLLLLERI